MAKSSVRGIVVAMLCATAWSATVNEGSGADDEVRGLTEKALAASRKGDSKTAVHLLTKAIEADADSAGLLRWRGREYFRLGEVSKSIVDFDRYVKALPAEEKTLWERGISLYYDGQFDRGAAQFELYQTYHDNDVENAVWRYLCVARDKGVPQARRTLLPIKNDRRVPMMKIYDLYQGKATSDDVMAAAKAGEPDEAELKHRLFYAHLYIGLFHEAAGAEQLARQHIQLAAQMYPISHYMGDVARVHAARLAKAKAANAQR